MPDSADFKANGWLEAQGKAVGEEYRQLKKKKKIAATPRRKRRTKTEITIAQAQTVTDSA